MCLGARDPQSREMRDANLVVQFFPGAVSKVPEDAYIRDRLNLSAGKKPIPATA